MSLPQPNIEHILNEDIPIPKFVNVGSMRKGIADFKQKLKDKFENCDDAVSQLYMKAANHLKFNEIPRRGQLGMICYLFERAENESNLKVPTFKMIGEIVGVNSQVVWNAYMDYLNDLSLSKKCVGNQAMLNEIDKEKLLKEIENCFQQKFICTTPMLCKYCNDELKVHVTTRTINKLLKKLGYKKYYVIPDEDKRLDPNVEEIKNFFNVYELRLNNVPVAFIFNLDEVGYSLWSDKKPVKTIIPPGEKLDKTERKFGISRSDPHTSFLACIGMDGFAVPGQMICQCKTLSSNVLGTGVVDLCKFVSKEGGYIDIPHFLYWLEHVFVKFVNKKRIDKGYTGKAYFIMDQCPAHMSPIVNEILEPNNIEVVYLVSHCSYLLQPLDLGIFGNQKMQLRTLLGKLYKLAVNERSDSEDSDVVTTNNQASSPEGTMNKMKQISKNLIFESHDINENDDSEDDEGNGESNNETYEETQERMNKISEKVVQILDTYQMATITSKVKNSFLQCGFKTVIRYDDVPVCQVDTSFARALVKKYRFFETREVQPIQTRQRKTVNIKDIPFVFPISRPIDNILAEYKQLHQERRLQIQQQHNEETRLQTQQQQLSKIQRVLLQDNPEVAEDLE
ncbi:DDE-1 domain-containing protein [Entamoeba marina]